VIYGKILNEIEVLFFTGSLVLLIVSRFLAKRYLFNHDLSNHIAAI